MKKSLAIFTALSLSLAASACTHSEPANTAQSGQSNMASGQWQQKPWNEQDHMRIMRVMANAMFDGMDKNHDGVVTKKEYEEYSRKWFREADADHDGKLTRDEFIAQLQREKKRLVYRVHHKDDADKDNDDHDQDDMGDEGGNN